MKKLLVIIAALALPFLAGATDYYASPTGSSTNNGLFTSTPWPLQYALDNCGDSNTVIVMDGVYTSAGNDFYVQTLDYVTVRAQNRWKAILANNPRFGMVAVSFAPEYLSHHLVLDGLCISNNLADGVQLTYGCVIKNCWIVDNATNPTNKYQGINLSGVGRSNNVIEYNLIENNGKFSIFDQQIYLSGPNHIVRGNVIRNGKGYGMSIYTAYEGVWMNNIQIYNNLIYGHTNFYGCFIWGAVSEGDPGSLPGTNYLFNNTILDGLDAAYGTLRITNNILSTSPFDPSDVINTHEPDYPVTITADYNLSTIAYTESGANDVITNYVGFVNTNSGLYWLKADSPARGAAKTTVFSPLNFFGHSRNSVSDIGAFQYGAALAGDLRVLDPSPAAGANYWFELTGGYAAAATIANLRVGPVEEEEDGIIAASASLVHVQAAVDTAVNGNRVLIPNGSATWTGALDIGGKQISIEAQNITPTDLGTATRNVNITHNALGSALMSFTSGNSYHVRLSGIKFIRGTGTNEFCTFTGSGTKVPLISDCYFDVPNNFGVVRVVDYTALGGVIWNTMFESLSPGGASGPGAGSGCLRMQSPRAWGTASTMGTLDTSGDQNVYFEDCSFRHIYNQCIDVEDRARAVIRYSTVLNSCILTHGSTGIDGGRFIEFYNNAFQYQEPGFGDTFDTVAMNRYTWFRAGTGIFTDNSVEDINGGDWGNKNEFVLCVENAARPGQFGCATTYPAFHQIGFGHNGSAQVSDPVYFWNNTGFAFVVGLNDGSPNTCGGTTSTYCQEDRDYFIDAGAKSGYTKYTYPHPLR